MDFVRPSGRNPDSAHFRCGGAAQSLTLWLFIILGIVLLAAAFSATSIRDLIENRADKPREVDPQSAAAAPVNVAMPTAPPKFGLDQLRDVISVLGEDERERVLNDEAAFANLVRNERARWSVIQAARESGLDTSPKVAYLMERSADQVLADTYVKLNIGAAVPASFPSGEQIRQFYEQNRDRYRVEARIPVWQIFLPIPASADQAQVSETERRAKDLVSLLRSGTLEFAKAAAEHSAHQASRMNGGFMGYLQIGELIPEVKAAVTEAPVGQVLDPVRSPSGLHILKRGEQIDATQLSLDQVRDRIRASLRKAAETKAQQLVVARAREKSGDEPGEEQLKAWRAELAKTPPGTTP